MRSWIVACVATMTVACGHHGSSGNGDTDASGTGDAATIDSRPFPGMCTPNGPQCSNCKDDDGDGRIDGFDPECTGPLDNDEATFSTGIPGDNKDAVMQDCFFDGDSGAGNDGCNIHVCCLLGAKTVAECPIGANKYNPDDCRRRSARRRCRRSASTSAASSRRPAAIASVAARYVIQHRRRTPVMTSTSTPPTRWAAGPPRSVIRRSACGVRRPRSAVPRNVVARPASCVRGKIRATCRRAATVRARARTMSKRARATRCVPSRRIAPMAAASELSCE